MAYDFKRFDARAAEIDAWLMREFSGIRTGRATPTLLDLVSVEAYGSKIPLNQVGSVSVEDPRTIRISVWDASLVREVEKGLTTADLGVSVVVDGSGLRVIFPMLTSERRVQLLKIAKGKLEEARVSIRGARDEAMKEIDALGKSGDMSEDDRFGAKEDLQKRVEACNRALEGHYDQKEKEINE
jgi:ribosome recycling factor